MNYDKVVYRSLTGYIAFSNTELRKEFNNKKTAIAYVIRVFSHFESINKQLITECVDVLKNSPDEGRQIVVRVLNTVNLYESFYEYQPTGFYIQLAKYVTQNVAEFPKSTVLRALVASLEALNTR